MKKPTVKQHSDVVGGSTAERVMACPASVELSRKVPRPPGNEYTARGTMLHSTMEMVLTTDVEPETLIGYTEEKQTLTADLVESKIRPALAALDDLDPEQEMEFACEVRVEFGKFLPDVFGSVDLIGRRSAPTGSGARVVVVDWKFGDGVVVDAEESKQLMFYAAAARRTPKVKHLFEGATEVELVIVQPPEVRRWVTTPARLDRFEVELKRAVKLAQAGSADYAPGEHCRWCPGKPLCPKMTGAAERALRTTLDGIDPTLIGKYLGNAALLEQWIEHLRETAFNLSANGVKIPGYKLVAKRATRKWVDEGAAKSALLARGLKESDLMDVSMKSPAQVEKLLKPLPDDLVTAVSSGSTLVPEMDPRPALLQIGQQVTAALAKLV